MRHCCKQCTKRVCIGCTAHAELRAERLRLKCRQAPLPGVVRMSLTPGALCRPFQTAASALQRTRRRGPDSPEPNQGQPFSTLHFNALFGEVGSSPEKAAPAQAAGTQAPVQRGALT